MTFFLRLVATLGIASSLQCSFALPSSDNELQSRQTTIPDGWNSLGCYTDISTSRTLRAVSYSGSSMTIASCLAFCQDYQYAGVEYARECYCDNTIRSPGAPTNLGECNKPCAGDSATFCGAGNRINVYTQTVQVPVPSIKSSVGSWQYKGCFEDFGGRILKYHIAVPQGVSAETCTATCRANGYGLAGLEYGKECWCDNYMPFGRPFDDGSCNMPCEGDRLELCGAARRLALYQDDDATPLDPNACIPNRQGFQNFQLQAISRQGPLNAVQIFPVLLNPNNDNAPQYTILAACSTCPNNDNRNFAMSGGVVTPYGLFGNPQPLLPPVGESQVFYGFLSVVGYAGYCSKPNPVSPTGPFVGFPVLSVDGHAELWGLCANTSAGGRADVVYSPVANHPHYNRDDCRDVYLQMSQYYVFIP